MKQQSIIKSGLIFSIGDTNILYSTTFCLGNFGEHSTVRKKWVLA